MLEANLTLTCAAANSTLATKTKVSSESITTSAGNDFTVNPGSMTSSGIIGKETMAREQSQRYNRQRASGSRTKPLQNMPKSANKKPAKIGPKPDTLEIEGNWKDAVKKSLAKKKPAEVWPKEK